METGFGWIVVGRDRYDHDIIIHTDGTVSKRKKKASKALKSSYSHTPLSHHELDFVSDERPEVIYVGTGQYGDLPVTPEAGAILKRYGAVIRATPEILPLLEPERRRYVAILHVTC